MATLLFFIVILTLLIIAVKIGIHIFHGKNYKYLTRTSFYVVTGYALLWLVFYFMSGYVSIPFGKDICFDDWCITLSNIKKTSSIGTIHSKNEFIILQIKVSNRARGIAQKPSEPRIHIIDTKGNSWNASSYGQQALEKLQGQQAPLEKRLELNETLETQLVFDVPKKKGLKVLVEEGPFITKLLLNGDKEVFAVPYP